MSRLVSVSNRVSIPRRGSAPGGLVVGLMAAMHARGGLWFGWDGEVGDSSGHGAEDTRRDAISYTTLSFSAAEYEHFYLGFCNATLWPVFHYFLTEFRYDDRQYEAYLRVNQRFAHELGQRLHPDDVIWVHDYHLLPLAHKLRQLGVRQPIGLFLHTPFPTIEILRALPVHAELIQMMLDFDLIGFQTENDLYAFRSAIRHLWGMECLADDGTVTVGPRRLRIDVFPIGVDVEGVDREATAAARTTQYRRMVDGLLGRKLMIGVDRLDYSKGLVERFRAYDRFLETFPENRNHVAFMQIAPLSRTDVHAYATIRRELEQTAGRINGRFADTDWTPIRYLNRNFPHELLMGFMRAAPVGIVTPVRDGMNLVAKEFVAAQDAADPGVLILSSMAGAARELATALQVNPYDTRAMAQAIQQALTMPLAERRERHAAMMDVLRRNDIHAWYRRFLEQLERQGQARLAAQTEHREAG